MKRQSTPWDTFFVVAMMLIASVCAHAQAAVPKEAEASDSDVEASLREAQAPDVEEQAYWIGIRGRSIESAVLRTHLQLAEGMGVVVEEVLADSPAAKAGLRKHDILLRVNGDAIDNMQVLQSQVRAGKEKPLELTIIRLGKQEKMVIVPEVLPQEVAAGQRLAAQPLGRFNGRGLDNEAMQQLFEQLGMRNLGPGMGFRGGQMFNFNQIPDGVSVSIQRNNDGPAQITVKQGDKTWQIEEGDEKSLQQLPDEVRPFVERILSGQNNLQGIGGTLGLRDLEAELEGVLPRELGNFRPRGGAHRQPFDRQEDSLRKRMEQLEKRLQQLQKRLDNGEPALPLDKTT